MSTELHSALAPACVTVARRGKTALIGLASPPVNALGFDVRDQLFRAMRDEQDDALVEVVVLHGTGCGFSAGGDIKEFGTPRAQEGPGLASDLHPLIENASKPVIAAIHGFALGGGLETAMACHYRVGSRAALVGLPEIGIGLIPPSGTQRLPRLVGLERATRMILGAEKVSAASLEDTPLFDSLVDEDTVDAVVEAALALASSDSLAPRRTRDLAVPGTIDAARFEHATLQQRAALRALQASATLPFDAGMEVAMAAYRDCYSVRSHAPARA